MKPINEKRMKYFLALVAAFSVVVFHGPAVKMISTDRSGFKETDHEELDKFATTIRQMSVNGVKFEVCDYALEVNGVDPKTVLPEVNYVPNGFISLAG